MPNVLVFPSCNEPGLELVESLIRHPGFRVVGASSLDRAVDPSVAMLQRHVTLPSLHDPGFQEAFAALLHAESIDLVFASVDVVIEALAQAPLARGVLVGPSAEAARVCASKVLTYQALANAVPLPESYADREVYPAFAKPDRGGGSRGTRMVRTPEERAAALAEGCVVQQWLPGDEYTVDCCGDRDGRLLVARARRRSAIGRGIALATEAVDDPELLRHVTAIADRLRIAGPFFVQFKRDADGVARLLEVNARVGGSMTASRVDGLNLPLMAAFSFLGYDVKAPRPVGARTMVRRLQQVGTLAPFDAVIWDLDDTLVHRDGLADPMAVAHLLDLHHRGVRQWLLTLNTAPEARLQTAMVPAPFEAITITTDKVAALHSWFESTGLTPERTLMINDSYTERLAIEARYPGLRCLTPDGLDALGWRAR